MSSRQRGMSKNQIKKRSEQNSEMDKKKAMTISTEFNFADTAIIGIEKNNGFCFEGKIIFTKSSKKYDTNVKVLHARGKGGRSAFMNTRSKLGLVSLTSITLPHGAVGTVEEWITPNHLNAYINNGLINQEDYDKLNSLIGKTGFDEKEDTNGGFVFDENAGGGGGGIIEGNEDDGKEISIDEI